jgi:UDP:flavonoid glycosyltransferase YjiC (YdhE family)
LLDEKPIVIDVRVLVSTVPAHGHLLPVLPLARALGLLGHTVGVLTSAELTPVVHAEGLEMVTAGPAMDALFAESARHHGDAGTTATTATKG